MRNSRIKRAGSPCAGSLPRILERSMDWTELKIEISSADADRAADIANMTVPYGLYLEDYSDLEELAPQIAHIDLIDEELLSRDRSRARLHVYISPEESPQEAVAFLRERYTAEGIAHTIETAAVREADWANNWKQFFHPIAISPRLTVCPAWEKCSAPAGSAVLRIDPGAAFGTGTHATTRLCLEALCEYLKPGASVLDVGCGSGILAVASLLLGAERAVGVDIDHMAVRVAQQTARDNGVQDRADFRCGDLTDCVCGRYDVICANIVADVVITLCGTAADFLSETGYFICSGIIDTREHDVLTALVAHGFAVKRRYESGGWVAFVTQRA